MSASAIIENNHSRQARLNEAAGAAAAEFVAGTEMSG
jgi:hypothetical protein